MSPYVIPVLTKSNTGIRIPAHRFATAGMTVLRLTYTPPPPKPISMFQIYLPIAEMSVNMFAILALGGATGVLSGLFGVGGGFLTTPFLIFIGVPPTVAVATSANQIVAASVSGFMTQWRRKMVDFKMGNYLLAGGLVGSTLGIGLFELLEKLGQIDLVISVSYVTFLSIIGILMGVESVRAIMGAKSGSASASSADKHHWSEWLPLQTEFPASKLRQSILLPLFIGLFIGLLVSIMGIGGGFFMIPAMIYLLRMPTSVVIGTSLYQIIFITANVTILHAFRLHTVDIVLALLLLTGSALGAQIGSRMGQKIPSEQLRGLMAVLVLAVASKLAHGLFVQPDNLYSYELEVVQ
jgi:uncharacterized membrane protein YfcA